MASFREMDTDDYVWNNPHDPRNAWKTAYNIDNPDAGNSNARQDGGGAYGHVVDTAATLLKVAVDSHIAKVSDREQDLYKQREYAQFVELANEQSQKDFNERSEKERLDAIKKQEEAKKAEEERIKQLKEDRIRKQQIVEDQKRKADEAKKHADEVLKQNESSATYRALEEAQKQMQDIQNGLQNDNRTALANENLQKAQEDMQRAEEARQKAQAALSEAREAYGRDITDETQAKMEQAGEALRKAEIEAQSRQQELETRQKQMEEAEKWRKDEQDKLQQAQKSYEENLQKAQNDSSYQQIVQANEAAQKAEQSYRDSIQSYASVATFSDLQNMQIHLANEADTQRAEYAKQVMATTQYQEEKDARLAMEYNRQVAAEAITNSRAYQFVVEAQGNLENIQDSVKRAEADAARAKAEYEVREAALSQQIEQSRQLADESKETFDRVHQAYIDNPNAETRKANDEAQDILKKAQAQQLKQEEELRIKQEEMQKAQAELEKRQREEAEAQKRVEEIKQKSENDLDYKAAVNAVAMMAASEAAYRNGFMDSDTAYKELQLAQDKADAMVSKSDYHTQIRNTEETLQLIQKREELGQILKQKQEAYKADPSTENKQSLEIAQYAFNENTKELDTFIQEKQDAYANDPSATNRKSLETVQYAFRDEVKRNELAQELQKAQALFEKEPTAENKEAVSNAQSALRNVEDVISKGTFGTAGTVGSSLNAAAYRDLKGEDTKSIVENLQKQIGVLKEEGKNNYSYVMAEKALSEVDKADKSLSVALEKEKGQGKIAATEPKKYDQESLEKNFKWLEVRNADDYKKLTDAAKAKGLTVITSERGDFIGKDGRRTHVLLVAREDMGKMQKIKEETGVNAVTHSHEHRQKRMDDVERQELAVKASTNWAAKEFTELYKLGQMKDRFEHARREVMRSDYRAAAGVIAATKLGLTIDSKAYYSDKDFDSLRKFRNQMTETLGGEYTGKFEDFDPNRKLLAKDEFGNVREMTAEEKKAIKEDLDRMAKGNFKDRKEKKAFEETKKKQRALESVDAAYRKFGLNPNAGKFVNTVNFAKVGTTSLFARVYGKGTGTDDSDIMYARMMLRTSKYVTTTMFAIANKNIMVLKNKVALRLKPRTDALKLRIRKTELGGKIHAKKEELRKKTEKRLKDKKEKQTNYHRKLDKLMYWSPTAVKYRMRSWALNKAFHVPILGKALNGLFNFVGGIKQKLAAFAGAALLAFVKLAMGIGGFLIILMLVTNLLDYEYVPSDTVTYLLYNQVLLQDENQWREKLTNRQQLFEMVQDRDVRFGHYYLPWEDYASIKDHLVYYNKTLGLGALGDVNDNSVYINPFEFVPVNPQNYLTEITAMGERDNIDEALPEYGKFINLIHGGTEPADDELIYCRPQFWGMSGDADDTYEVMGPYKEWKGYSTKPAADGSGRYLTKWEAYTDERGNNNQIIDIDAEAIYTYEGPTFEDGTPFRRGMFGDAGIMLEYLPNISSTAWYGNSGHTSNIKDIICMMDVMFQFEAKDDTELAEEADEPMINIISEKVWECIFDLGKLIRNFFNPDDKIPMDMTGWDEWESWTHMTTYCRMLFEVSHQEMLDIDVILFDCTLDKTDEDYLSTTNEELGHSLDPTDVEYLESTLGALMRGGCPLHYLKQDDGTEKFLGGCQAETLYAVIFDDAQKNLHMESPGNPIADTYYRLDSQQKWNQYTQMGNGTTTTIFNGSDEVNSIGATYWWMRFGLGMNGYEKHYYYSDGTDDLGAGVAAGKTITAVKADTDTSMVGVVGALKRGTGQVSEFDHVTLTDDGFYPIGYDDSAETGATIPMYCLPGTLCRYLQSSTHGGTALNTSGVAMGSGAASYSFTMTDLDNVRLLTKDNDNNYCWYCFEADCDWINTDTGCDPSTFENADVGEKHAREFPNQSVAYSVWRSSDDCGSDLHTVDHYGKLSVKSMADTDFWLPAEKWFTHETSPNIKNGLYWNSSWPEQGSRGDYGMIDFVQVVNNDYGQSIVMGGYKWVEDVTKDVVFDCNCTNDATPPATGTVSAAADHTLKVTRLKKKWKIYVWSNCWIGASGMMDNSDGVNSAGDSVRGNYIGDNGTGAPVKTNIQKNVNLSRMKFNTDGYPQYFYYTYIEDSGLLNAFGLHGRARNQNVMWGTCHGHCCRFCGGHTLVNVKGIIFSFTDDEIIYAEGRTADQPDAIQVGERELVPVINEDVLADRTIANQRKYYTYSAVGGYASSWRDHMGDAALLDSGKVAEDSLFGRYYYRYLIGSGETSLSGMNGMNYQMNGALWAATTEDGPQINPNLMVELQSVRKFRSGWVNKWAGLGKDDTYKVNQMLLYAQDIFDIDQVINYPKGFFPYELEQDYEGWTETNMLLALLKYNMSWEDTYSFDIPVNMGSTQLSEDQISQIMDAIDANSLSAERKKAVELALYAVGNGSYSQAHHSHGYLMYDCSRYNGTSGSYLDGSSDEYSNQTALDKAIQAKNEEYTSRTTDSSGYSHSCTCTDASGFVSYIMNLGHPGTVYDTDALKGMATNHLIGVGSLQPGDILVYYPPVDPSDTNYDWGADHSHHALVYLGTPSEDVTITWLDQNGNTTFDAYKDGSRYASDLRGGIVLGDPDGAEITFKMHTYLRFKAGEPIFVDANRFDQKGNIYIRGGYGMGDDYFYPKDHELMDEIDEGLASDLYYIKPSFPAE